MGKPSEPDSLPTCQNLPWLSSWDIRSVIGDIDWGSHGDKSKAQRMLATQISLFQADHLSRREGLELLYARDHLFSEDWRADRTFQPALSFSLDVCESDAKCFVYTGQSAGKRRFRRLMRSS